MMRKFNICLCLSLETYKAVLEKRSKKFSSKSEKNSYFFRKKKFNQKFFCTHGMPFWQTCRNFSVQIKKSFAQSPKNFHSKSQKKEKRFHFSHFFSSDKVHWSHAKTSENLFCRFLNFLCRTSQKFFNFRKKNSPQTIHSGHAECSFVNPAERF